MGTKKMVEIDCRYVMRTKWFISALRTSLRSIFTTAKAKSTANITITGLHVSKLFNPAIHFSKLGVTGRTLLSVSRNSVKKFLMFNASHPTSVDLNIWGYGRRIGNTERLDFMKSHESFMQPTLKLV